MTDNGLQEFDPFTDYFEGLSPISTDHPAETDSDEDQLEGLRRNAFMQDAMQYKDDAFWNNYIERKSEARKAEREMQGKECERQMRRIKRNRLVDEDEDIQIVSKNRGRRSDEDSEIEVLGVRNSSTTSASPTRQHEHSCQRRRVGTSSLPTPGPTPVKGSQSVIGNSAGDDLQTASDDSEDGNLFVGQSANLSNPFVSDDDDDNDDGETRREEQVETKREANLQYIRDHPPK